VNHKTFVIMFTLQENKFVFINCIHFQMSLVMVAINKTIDCFIFKNYLLHHNKKTFFIHPVYNTFFFLL